MRADIKALWVAALRGGEYEQGRGRLRGSDGFCCYGVLCDLAVKAGVVAKVVASPADRSGWNVTYDGSGLMPPISVRDWADLDFVPVEVDGTTWSLETLNDNGREFAEIADLIEAQL